MLNFPYKFSAVALIALSITISILIPPIVGGDEIDQTIQCQPTYQYTQPAPTYGLPIHQAVVAKPLPVVIKPLKIDLAIIAVIESGADKSAINGAHKGMFQMKRGAWEDAIKILGKDYSYDSWSDVRKHTKEVADCYFHKCIPAMLKAKGVPVNLETTIGAYNHGANNMKVLYRKYGKYWIKRSPKETQDYIDSYKNLYVDKNK
jgi:hypothetical protein